MYNTRHRRAFSDIGPELSDRHYVLSKVLHGQLSDLGVVSETVRQTWRQQRRRCPTSELFCVQTPLSSRLAVALTQARGGRPTQNPPDAGEGVQERNKSVVGVQA